MGILATVTIGGLLAVANRDPLGWTIARWHDLRGNLVVVGDVSATAKPGQATVEGTTPAALTDGTGEEWTTPWRARTASGTCGGAPHTPTVLLTFPSTRIRAVEVRAGLPAARSERPLQFRPKAIGIFLGHGACRRLVLKDVAGTQRFLVDSGSPVTSLRIGVDTTFRARADGAQQRLSFTEITLKSRPR